jgi:hypothetical protein
VTECVIDLETQAYVVVRQLIHPLHCEALRQFADALRGQGLLREDPSKRRFRGGPPRQVGHGYPAMQYFHEQIEALVQRLTDKRLRRNYACLFHYPAGSCLPPHRDFSHCRLAVSVTLDRTSLASDLTLVRERGADPIVVALNPGDAVIYYGEQLIHYREPLPPGESTTAAVFCFTNTHI